MCPTAKATRLQTVIKSPTRDISFLLVEDEALIRMMVAGMIEELGQTVAAEAGNIADALNLAQQRSFASPFWILIWQVTG
jgi:CheY-like chemotaxis protein